MAIARGGYRLLLEESRRRPFSGSVMQLGRNTVYLNPDDMTNWAAVSGVGLHNCEIRLSQLPRFADIGMIDDTTMFSSLGFSTVHSCDISGNELPTYVLDLNQPISEDMHSKYDVVIDSGTIEHIFHLPNVLQNIHSLLKTGGRAVFMTVPSSNYVDHGYYMFSPQLLYDYLSINRYTIISSYVIFFKNFFQQEPWEIYSYVPGVLDPYCFGGMPKEMVSFWICAEKTEDSVSNLIPQQGCSRTGINASAVLEHVADL